MPVMDVVGWIVVGFIAGALSGLVVGGRTARGCLPNILVGVRVSQAVEVEGLDINLHGEVVQ